MANYDSNYAIAQQISARLGNSPIPFDSVYSICLQIYQELGGEEQNFDSVYSILLEILPLVEGGISSQVIDDSSISLTKTWSSSKIASELAGAGFNVEIVTELPSVGDPHTIYFILKPNSSTGDTYDEWMYINNNWEKVGNTGVDLSDYATLNDISTFITLDDTSIYATKTYVDASLATKADVYEVATVAEIEALFAAPEPEPTYPPLNELWYTTPNGQAISGEYITYGIHNADYESITLTSNTYQGGKGVLTFADDIYEMQYWGGQSDCGDIEKVWLPYFTSANADSLALTEILSGQQELTDVYYPGTISELSYFMFPEDAGIEWDTLSAAGTRTFHCSDGDYTLPDLY